MNTYIDFSDVIKILCEKGYTWTYDSGIYDIGLGGDEFEVLSPDDFHIDQVYCCKTPETLEICYVFAFSSVKHNLKFIAINVITKETSITLVSIIDKIKNGINNLLNR